MKKIFILMTGIFLLSCNSGEEKKTESEVKYSDLESQNLKGDISSVEEAPYKTDSTGKIGEMDSCCVSVSDYDENGNNTKSVSKDSKGTLSSESVITHHANGLF